MNAPAALPARLDRLLLVGVDHRSADLEARERVTLDSAQCAALLQDLGERPEVAEACVLSTCNRTEIYVCGNGEDPYPAVVAHPFEERAPELVAEGRLYARRGDDAARHLLRVAAGLESMVLGESEILGQVRQAAELAAAMGSSGTLLQPLLRVALDAGRRARRETAIGAGAVSLGSVAVELAGSIFRDIEDRSALVLGAGETARMVARGLLDGGVRRIAVSNRGGERLAALVAQVPQIETVPWERRSVALERADLVFVTTAAPRPVLLREELAELMRRRGGRHLLVVDLAVPRNVEGTAGNLSNLFLHTVDTLQVLVERNLEQRRRELQRVEGILDREFALLRERIATATAEPVVAELQRRAEHIRRQEVLAARNTFPASLQPQIDELTRSLVRKLLHHPSATLRQPGEAQPAQLELVRRLFRLDDREEV